MTYPIDRNKILSVVVFYLMLSFCKVKIIRAQNMNKRISEISDSNNDEEIKKLFCF